MTDAAISGNAVRPGYHRDRHLCNSRTVSPHIGALVEVEYVLEGQNVPVGIDRGAGVVALLPRVVGRHQMLAPVLDPLYRPAQSHRGETNEKVFRVELAADPEPAAGIAFLQHHCRCTAAEHARQRVAIAVWHLGRAVQFQDIPCSVEAGERAARFERNAAVPTDFQVESDDGMRGSKGPVDIPVTGAQHQRLG